MNRRPEMNENLDTNWEKPELIVISSGKTAENILSGSHVRRGPDGNPEDPTY
jgi:hypothetical protein